MKNDKFEVGLLWKQDKLGLPETKIMALHKLALLEKKLDKDEKYAKIYSEKFQDYIDKGYIKKLSNKEAQNENPNTWYSPNFGVTNSNKPDKL